MKLCEINDEKAVREFKEKFNKKLNEGGFYWILLETKVIPEGSEDHATRIAYGVCRALQKDSYKGILKIFDGGEVKFGNTFESMQDAIYKLVNYCLLSYSQPDKIGPRNSIFLPENHFSLEVDEGLYDNNGDGYFWTNVRWYTGGPSKTMSVEEILNTRYRSFNTLAAYDRAATNSKTVVQREQEELAFKQSIAENAAREKTEMKKFENEHSTLNTVLAVLKVVFYPIPWVGLVYFFVEKIIRKRSSQIASRFFVAILLLIYAIISTIVFNSFVKMIKKPNNDYSNWTPPEEIAYDVDYIN